MKELSESKIEIFKDFKGKTPAYVHFEEDIIKNLNILKSFPNEFGLIVRFAMKANPNLSLLKLMNNNGIWIDASSTNECYRAMAAGIEPNHILLTSQDVPSEEVLNDLVKKGVEFNATSLTQLELYGKLFPRSEISIRFNIGIGSGWNTYTATGGENSSFGIYKQRDEIKSIIKKYNLTLKRVHLHIGSGSDPIKQKEATIEGLKLIEEFDTASILNLGGGFKIARVYGEKQTDVVELGNAVREEIKKFYKKTNRKIQIEIEPGGYAIGNQVYIVGTIIDIVTTGRYDFIKLDTGMTDNTRIAMYGAQHPIYQIESHKDSIEKDYVIVGPCCESGDIITCKPNNPEEIDTVKLKEPKMGDLIVIGGAGAYCSSMASFNYNSKQKSVEYLVRKNGNIDLIRKKQELENVWADDILLKNI